MSAPTPFPPVGPQRGVVEAFDSHVCLGTIAGDDGARWEFHCTALTDGSREVARGAHVGFVVVRRPGGRFEADRICVDA
ncbi:MAG: cold shock domain-containing protein [Microthrixaceae bacterium]|nr:cold shock domain-containing protein [Microthrixaceae bacterium]